MEHSYKIVLFGNEIYHEIELAGKKEVKIGTTNACTLRLDEANFFENFILQFVYIDDKWRLMCSDNLYIASEGIVKQYSVDLSHGDEIKIKYQNGNADLFYVNFLIDFEHEGSDYSRRIDINHTKEITIGGKDDCDIQIVNDYIADDFITLIVSDESYTLLNRKARYGIYVNGFKVSDDSYMIKDYDFFMLAGCQFYVKDGFLYTSSSNVAVKGNLTFEDIVEQNNKMEYPKFQRNTRVHMVLPDEKVNVLPPKQKPTKQDRNLLATLAPTVISTVVMIMLRSMMGGNKLFIIYGATTMLIGICTSIGTYIGQNKKFKKDMNERQTVYTQYAKERERYIQNLRVQEKQVLDNIYISPNKEIEEAFDFDARLFEKSREDSDFLEIYVGRGDKKALCEVQYKELDYKETEDKFLEYPKMLHDEYEYLKDVPIVIDFKAINCLGVVGDRQSQYEILKNITLDLAIRHFYEDVKLYYVIPEADISKFEWIRWFKNVRNDNNSMRNFMYDEDSKKVLLELLYEDLSMRESLSKEILKTLPNKVVFVYSIEDLEKHPVSHYVKECNKYGYTFIFFNEYQELIPQGCDKFIYLEDNNEGVIRNSSNENEGIRFKYDLVDDSIASRVAKKLGCVYVDSVNLESKLTNNITLYKLLGILGVDDLDLSDRWSQSKVFESMAAPLGVRSDDTVVYLDLNEKNHGPHGLVAGTTGSGKSEILQSYILSMATLFHPYEVGFVIIDFKGGGMVNQFKDLPHLIGAITNIDGQEIERSLSSIKAELRKRQEVFAKYNVNHIDAYIKLYKQGKAELPLPHLILIVDEFAELKSDQPEFMKELISAARIGRSLGVHLILATQKPSGVVDEQIWSNSKFKLCLKVQNKNDSNEVLKSPLAAEIKEPGRAYFQVGNNEIFELFQSAYSGADINADKMGTKKAFRLYGLALNGKRRVLYEQKREKASESETQLKAIVKYVNNYCQETGIQKLPGICLPSLESVINFENSEVVTEIATDISVCVGIYDDPNNQLQDKYVVNLTQNNTFILGTSQYGKTNLLQVILKGLASKYSPNDVNIYILDFASMILKTYESLNHVGGVITASDDEKLKNFFKMMADEINKRKAIISSLGLSSYSAYRDSGYTDIPQIVIMVDNITALRELYLMSEDSLLPICREGLAVGISVIITSTQMSGTGYKYLSNFANKIGFYCNDSTEYSTLYGIGRLKCRNIPGRAICLIDNEHYELQTYLAFEGKKEIDRVKEVRKFISQVNEEHGTSQAKAIPTIPNILTKEYAQKQFGASKPYEFLMGLDYKNVQPYYLNLLNMNVLAVSGRDGMGKHHLVRRIIDELEASVERTPSEIYIYDNMERRFSDKADNKSVKNYTLKTDGIIENINTIYEDMRERYEKAMSIDGADYLKSKPYILVIIQNNDVIETLAKDKEALTQYKEIITKFKNLKVGFILGNIENVAIPFSANEIMKGVKDAKHYVIFEDIANVKLLDVSISASKEYKKAIELGDCYYFKDNYMAKLKLVK